jgi:hypothetical protein
MTERERERSLFLMYHGLIMPVCLRCRHDFKALSLVSVSCIGSIEELRVL